VKTRDGVLKFQALRSVRCIVGFATRIVTSVFPGVKKRFEKSARWHRERHGITPEWGLFWNVCINSAFDLPGASPLVHTGPHADEKNAVAICLLLIYVMAGAEFNHTQRSWLVIWEAGVVVELPPWVIAAYPSSLFLHFNIDVNNIRFVTTEGDVRPTPATSRPLVEGDNAGRGSCVFYNQASMYAASETGHGSIAAARLAGASTTSDYVGTAQEAFQKYVAYPL